MNIKLKRLSDGAIIDAVHTDIGRVEVEGRAVYRSAFAIGAEVILADIDVDLVHSHQFRVDGDGTKMRADESAKVLKAAGYELEDF